MKFHGFFPETFPDKPTFELVCYPECYKPWPLVCESEDEKLKLIAEIQQLIDKCSSTSRRNSTSSPAPSPRATVEQVTKFQ
jgi:hypothetical protein